MTTQAEPPAGTPADDPAVEPETWQERRRRLGLTVQSRRLRWWWAAARRRPRLAVIFVGQVFGLSLAMAWLEPGETVRHVVQAVAAFVMPLTLVGWRMRIARELEQDDELAERHQPRPPVSLVDVEQYPATLSWRSTKAMLSAVLMGVVTTIGAGIVALAVWQPGSGGSEMWAIVGVFVGCALFVDGAVCWELLRVRRRIRAGHPVPARVLGFVPGDQYVVVESLDGQRWVVLLVMGRHAVVAGDEVALIGELTPVGTWFGKGKRLPYALSGPFGTVWGGRVTRWQLPESLYPYQPEEETLQQRLETLRADTQARGRPRAR